MAARKRIDPPSTSADGYQPLDQVDNRDPDRVYAYVNPNDIDTGVESYKADGYVVELKRPDGPRIPLGYEAIGDGDVITRRGQYLMSAPRQVKADKDTETWDAAKRFDKATLKSGNLDPMRGMHGRTVSDGDGVQTHQQYEYERSRAPGV